ncbi:MFS transporter [Colwellia marinimaniae]|uniref:MFS transporter n=1 Tax=Colwellia marinimaniae TaxID=1513592 RepID=A0ABQ0MQV3_9GAMM|nr:MFS transporter [Colwellia marinimaniae]
MSNIVSVKRFKQFPKLMWILLFGSFITRGNYYMVWPFLAVILYEKFTLSATHVGLILSSAAVIAVLVSFVGSALTLIVMYLYSILDKMPRPDFVQLAKLNEQVF